MWKYLQIAGAVLSLLPILIETVKAIEQAIPGKGRGEAKLAMIRETMEQVHSVAGDANIAFGQVWPILEGVINRVVSQFNSDGTFQR